MNYAKGTPIWVKRTADAQLTYQGFIVAHEPNSGLMAVMFGAEHSIAFTQEHRENVIWGLVR